MLDLSRAKRHRRRLTQLEAERAPFDRVWKMQGDYILPWETRFLPNERNNPVGVGFNLIHNPWATDCAERLAATMRSGITSPARPWYKLLPPDPKLLNVARVREWLYIVEETSREILLRGNAYEALYYAYLHLGTFGSHGCLMQPDYDDVIRFYPLPIGSFALTKSEARRINGLMYRTRLTVAEAIERFALTSDRRVDEAKLRRFSTATQRMWRDQSYDEPVDLFHVIEPNELYQAGRALSRLKRWAMCSYELNADDGDACLLEAGSDDRNFLGPRWHVTGEDTYGRGPGWKALPDVKELQFYKVTATEALDRAVDPATQAPSTMQGKKVQTAAGETTYVDVAAGSKGIEPIHVPDVDLRQLMELRAETRDDIARAFYADLFLMMRNVTEDGTQRTAREVAELHEEKLLVFGSVLERLQDELHEPIVEYAVATAARRGLVPPPPPEIVEAGGWLRLEVISVFHQAQKLIGLGAIERYSMWLGSMREAWPEIADKFDADAAADHYAQVVGVPPNIVPTGAALDEKRRARAEQERALVMAQAAQPLAHAARAARDLSETTESPDSLLARMSDPLNSGVPVAAA